MAIVDSNTAAAQAIGNTNVQPQFLKLKPENLIEAGNIDQLKFGASCLFATAKAYIASPTVQSIGKDMISKMPPSLQSKMTPNKALLSGAMLALLLIYMLYFVLGKLFGATKVFVFLSLTGLILAVSSPDWLEGIKANKPINLIVKSSAINFRRRWKENLINMTGYNNISDNVALASLVFILLFSGKTLLTSSPSSSSKMMPASSMPMGGGGNMHRSTMSAPQYDFEYIYKLGYDDAKAGHEFGLSLPDDIVSPEVPLPSTTSQYNDNNFDYPPLPPQNKSSGLGMGNLMSMFALYRFGKDIVTTPDGQVVMDPQYIMARLRSIETWRLGMLAISLYRVVSALSSFVR